MLIDPKPKMQMAEDDDILQISDRILQINHEVYSHLAQAQDDIRLGRVQSSDTVFAAVLNELENYTPDSP